MHARRHTRFMHDSFLRSRSVQPQSHVLKREQASGEPPSTLYIATLFRESSSFVTLRKKSLTKTAPQSENSFCYRRHSFQHQSYCSYISRPQDSSSKSSAAALET